MHVHAALPPSLRAAILLSYEGTARQCRDTGFAPAQPLPAAIPSVQMTRPYLPIPSAPAPHALPDGAAAAGNSELYDDVATPAPKEPSSRGSAMLRPQRTVSAPHAIVLPKSRLSRHNSGAAAHGGSSPALKAKDATAAAALMPSLRIPSLHWDADFGGDADRQAAHDRKMRSKIERAQQQLDHLSLRPGVVQHIHCTLSV